jgi:hypothetical protein
MAMTINPAVSGGKQGWLRHSGALFVGVFVGGVISMAAVLAVFAAARVFLSSHGLALAAAAVIVWAALHDLGVPIPLPYRPRQVPDWFREVFPPGVVAVAFGGMLGVGFLTLFTYSTHLAILMAIPFIPSFGTMLAVIGLFAFGKTLVLAGVANVSTLEDIDVRWNRRGIAALRVATALVSLGLAVSLVGHS